MEVAVEMDVSMEVEGEVFKDTSFKDTAFRDIRDITSNETRHG